MGNTDEMLIQPDTLEAFARTSKAPPVIWDAVREVAEATRSALGEDRLTWLRNLPRIHTEESFALVHATPESCWIVPPADATDAELSEKYGPLGRPVVVYAHIHQPAQRTLTTGMRLVNTGSVGLPYDGDPRASYLLLDDSSPVIRRVEYDIEKELQNLSSSGLPHAEWIARTLRAATPQLP
jgi:diadenosine tetraphosphatase ApaH/serine/threonine PP2A family protein phosphatase